LEEFFDFDFIDIAAVRALITCSKITPAIAKMANTPPIKEASVKLSMSLIFKIPDKDRRVCHGKSMIYIIKKHDQSQKKEF
jgi:hypothetical protein